MGSAEEHGKAVFRLGDVCTGHGCFPARETVQGSVDVNVNGIPVHRLGDQWASHTCDNDTHDGYLSAGSTTVNVNGKPMARVGDPVSCGSECSPSSGSIDVFAGG